MKDDQEPIVVVCLVLLVGTRSPYLNSTHLLTDTTVGNTPSFPTHTPLLFHLGTALGYQISRNFLVS